MFVSLCLSTSFLLGTGMTPRPTFAQSGNQSDITGVDLVETGINVISPTDTQTPEEQTPEEQTSEDQETPEGTAQTITPSDVDRPVLEQRLTESTTPPTVVFSLQSQALTTNYTPLLQTLGIQLRGTDPSPRIIARQLSNLANLTGNNAHYIQIFGTQTQQFVTTRIGPSVPNQSLTGPLTVAQSAVNPLKVSGLSKSLPHLAQSNEAPTPEEALVSRYITPPLPEGRIAQLVAQLVQQIHNDGTLNQLIGQRLYDLLIKPLEADLEAAGADTLVIALDADLLGLPIAALNDGNQFLVDKYAVAVVPSFGLSDIGFTDIRQRSLLAMGSQTFTDQAPLPAVPLEIKTLLQTFAGRSLLNESFTVDKFIQAFKEMSQQGDRPGIIHLATHGEFMPQDYRKSYIRFGDQPVSLVNFRSLVTNLGWDLAETAPELLVLSACRTAVGDPIAELGFGGLAVASGAKAALASLWYVSDVGTLALMEEFYSALKVNGLKSLALQQAQQHLRQGETRLESGKLRFADGRLLDLPPDLAKLPDQDFREPYYWAAFTLIGNWN